MSNPGLFFGQKDALQPEKDLSSGKATLSGERKIFLRANGHFPAKKKLRAGQTDAFWPKKDFSSGKRTLFDRGKTPHRPKRRSVAEKKLRRGQGDAFWPAKNRALAETTLFDGAVSGEEPDGSVLGRREAGRERTDGQFHRGADIPTLRMLPDTVPAILSPGAFIMKAR